MVATLIALSYSPWSEKARWSLDHTGAAYREVEYLPMLGTPWLRWKTKRWRGRVTVPALVDGATVLMDSFAIARHAATHRDRGDFAPAAVAPWSDLSEAMLAAGRARTMRRVAGDRQALLESLPKTFPKAVRGAFMPVGRLGVRYLTNKYGATGSDDEYLATLRDGVEELRAALRACAGLTSPPDRRIHPRQHAPRKLAISRYGLVSGERTGGAPPWPFGELIPAQALSDGDHRVDHLVGGRFTYADVAMAAALQFIKPVDKRYINVGGRASARCWTDPELAPACDDLFAWRDRLYAGFR